MAAGLCVQALPGAGLARGPRIRAVRAKADAFVSQASRTQNFGHARQLKIDSSPIFRTYVTFDVDLSSDDVQRVSLLLYGMTRSQVGYQIRLIRERWRERRITFANAPGLPLAFIASGPVRPRAWKVVDVTSLVAGEERGVSFVLTTNSPKVAKFGSRETGLHGPRLIVERRNSGTTSSTGTSTEGTATG